MISYSLYITHHFSGILTEFLVKKTLGESFNDMEKTLLLFVYALVSIGFAALFYRWVERPFINLAGKLKFGQNKTNT
jgi:peptidoglycan/LPS O-acetylase OafA/YrhL